MKLETYLDQNRITIQDFADSIGLTYEGLRLILRGERLPKLRTIDAIMEATGGNVTANDLVAGMKR